MGVAWVFEIDKSAKQVERLVEAGGGEQTGHYTVDGTSYRPIEPLQQNLNLLFVLHHSHFPQSTYAVAPGETFKQMPRATCDRGFDLILAKLSGGLQAETSGKFEVNGTEFELRDFNIRVGTATLGGVVKGVIVEVEYSPSFVASQASIMLTELVEMFFPEQVKSKPEVLHQTSPILYTALDTLYQYQQIFMRMRKKA